MAIFTNALCLFAQTKSDFAQNLGIYQVKEEIFPSGQFFISFRSIPFVGGVWKWVVEKNGRNLFVFYDGNDAAAPAPPITTTQNSTLSDGGAFLSFHMLQQIVCLQLGLSFAEIQIHKFKYKCQLQPIYKFVKICINSKLDLFKCCNKLYVR